MATFEELPFDAQLAWIERETETVRDATELVQRAAALPDVEPLCALLDRLANGGASQEALVEWYRPVLEGLSDPALQYVLEAALHHQVARAARREIARDAAETWPLSRASALALLAHWLTREDPPAALGLRTTATELIKAQSTAADPRWLFFVSGGELTALTEDPAWTEIVRETTHAVLNRLARAPKSLSQANAEGLLSRQVYADTGHFLFELIQNADDAGASEWRVAIAEGETTVTHDGAPFSFLDVVGVCSIGLTTKNRDAIGLFGVGFKSVFEVTARPRVHSGAFHFEIAHVSMPRPIAPEPGDDRTVLVLPHRSGVDAGALSDKAHAIPPETLLTLPHLRRLCIEGANGRVHAHTQERDGTRIALRSADGVRLYACAEETVVLGSVSSPVLVAAAMQADGSLEPRPEPGLFAFLPTAERTGLPVLVHARFEVTVDRERLETGSVRNRQLLECAGRLYATLIERAASEGHSVLGALPLESEISELALPLAEVLRSSLSEVPCLPTADGLVTPARARIVDARLVDPLRALDLGDGERALTHLDERDQQKARFLGARSFDDSHLRRFLELRLRDGAAAPAWLGSAVQRVLAESTLADVELRALPLLETSDGTLTAAHDARVASASWARLYAGVRPLVSRESLEAIDGRLRQRLGVASFRIDEIVADLARHPQLAERESALLDALEQAPDALIDRLREVPLFRDVDGRRHAAADGIRRLAPRIETLRDALSPLSLLADPSAEREHPDLFRRALPCFDVPELIEAMLSSSEMASLGPEALRGVAAALDASCDAEAPGLSSTMARRAATLAVFEDVHGVMRPLVGPGRALLSEDPELLRLLPELPWLATPEAPFVRMSPPPPFGARAMLVALVAGELATERWVDVVAWLGAHAGELTASDVDTLATLRIWPDAAGAPHRLEELRLASDDEAIERFYAATGLRRVAHPAAVRSSRQLRMGHALVASQYETAIADLLTLEDPSSIGTSVLQELIQRACDTVPAKLLSPLLDLPIFEDEAGTLRSVGSWEAPDPERSHRPGVFRPLLREASWPLISEEVDDGLAMLFESVGVASASVGDVARLGAALPVDPAALLEVLLAHAGELDGPSREAIGPLSLFTSRARELAPAADLAFADELVAALGKELVRELALDALLMTDAARAACERLQLSPRPHSEIVAHILGRLVEDTPLEEQPAGLRSRGDLLSVLQLAVDADVVLSDHALALDVKGRLVRGPLLDAPEGVRALAVQLPMGAALADATWAQDERAQPLLEPLSARAVATALKALGSEEHERTEHPVLRDPEAVFGWIREHGRDIESDDAARAALGSARVMPSQRGTLRAPNELVLSETAPDLGLAWGLAEDVPADVAAWLSDNYELDRQQRKSLVDHVLDGVDEAVESDDADRVVTLVRFLAASLGAERIAPEELDRRARRLKVRARLRVPATQGGFVKPRFGWAPTEATAALAESFMLSPPDRVGSELTDGPARALLAACGAAADLADEDVEALLEGEGLRRSPQARVALARYVAHRALSSPRLIARWDLKHRAWVPDRRGKLRRPADLLWPEPAVRALFGDDAGPVPEDSVVSDLPSEAQARLGFLSVEDLSPRDIGKRLGNRRARTALLMLLESGLAQSRFTPQALERAMRDRLTIRDDEGVVRRIGEVCIRGSRELFGHTRGDASILRQTPLLARAFSIPDQPNLAMMLAFLEEQGELLASTSSEAQRDLARHVPEVYRRLAERSRKGTQLELPPGAVVVAIHQGESRLVSLANPDLRLAEPSAIADAVEQAELDRLVLLTDVAPTLRHHLLAAGVADLLSGATVVAVEPGVRVTDLRPDAEQLHVHLARGLGPRVGRRVDVRERLNTTYRLELPTGEMPVTVEVDAALHGDTLYVTAAAIAEPALIAAALETEPRRRSSLAEWLSGDLHDTISKTQSEAARPTETQPSYGWLSKVWRFLGGTDTSTPSDEAPAPRKPRKPRTAQRPPKRATDADRDATMFRPQHEIASQLEGREGWVEARAKRPTFGFRFAPESLPTPWLYAPKMVATVFDRRSQSWQPTPLQRPESRGNAGTVRLQGALPAGDSVLPIPLYGRLTALSPADASHFPTTVGSMARLDQGGAATMDIVLGVAPDASAARVSSVDATRSFVPDRELPEEVLAFIEDLEPAPPLATAQTIRDFVRRRYRYDPTYLEDPSVARWLARVARGRAHAHVAALHAAADGEHLGAGVCHELNSLTCELLRRASIPAGIATGWVFSGGNLSEPDHLWVNMFLEGPRGQPIWVPIDASTTARGRPLRVARRPPVRAKSVASKRHAPPKQPKWATSKPTRRATGGQGSSSANRQRRAPSPKKERRAPRAELRRLVHYLERRTGREVTLAEKRELEAALEDPRGMVELLERLRGKT